MSFKESKFVDSEHLLNMQKKEKTQFLCSSESLKKSNIQEQIVKKKLIHKYTLYSSQCSIRLK
ncbi:unnamed protein product [Paramecium primaurelia]|uniref:Uncharacterized protein n=1 Tax=Paramecium primaurelia TaxID=5886 RepID=A0A8S1LTS5_PARPR|nr:unnamed protein product [Paramecium primaurelia]